MADGTAGTFGVLANAWKETVRDAIADIAASRESAKARARRAVHRRITDEAGRRKAYADLKHNRWADDPYLRRLMRQHWKHGRNRTRNQIVVRSDQYKTFTLREGGNAWLAVPGLARRQLVMIPLNTTVAPAGTLRLILRGGEVEVHYAIDAKNVRSSGRPCGTRTIGVDKGYTEVLTDSDGNTTDSGSAGSCQPSPTTGRSRTPAAQNSAPSRRKLKSAATMRKPPASGPATSAPSSGTVAPAPGSVRSATSPSRPSTP